MSDSIRKLGRDSGLASADRVGGTLPIAASIAALTARQLLAPKRLLVSLLLALIPVLVALLFAMRGAIGGDGLQFFVDRSLGLTVTTILPLVALVFGTGAFGSEIEDGTALFLLSKPVSRALMVTVRVAVASFATAIVVVPATILAGVLALGRLDPDRVVLGFAGGALVGSILYVALFTALGVATRRALVAGLLYVLVWEGMLAKQLSGLSLLSIRHYVLGVADAITTTDAATFKALLPATTAWIMTAATLLIALFAGTQALLRFEVGKEG